MGKPRMLAGLRALLIPIGWSANAAEETRKLLRELGAEVFSEEETGTDVSHSSQNKLDVAITALTSTSRIGRHLPRDSLNANLPVVASTWVKACADSGQMLPFKDYEVAVPDNFRPVHVKAKEEEPSPKKESKPVIPARPKRSSTLASLAADAAERRLVLQTPTNACLFEPPLIHRFLTSFSQTQSRPRRPWHRCRHRNSCSRVQVRPTFECSACRRRHWHGQLARCQPVNQKEFSNHTCSRSTSTATSTRHVRRQRCFRRQLRHTL